MKVLSAILVIALLHSSTASHWLSSILGYDASSSQPYSYCRSYECPSPLLVKSTPDYELRQYGPTVWVSTEVEKMDEEFWEDQGASSDSFKKLLRYVSGHNDKGQEIRMTVPVLIAHTKDKATMSIMLPRQFAADPPKPKESGVKLFNSRRGLMYVRSFGGFPYGLLHQTNHFQENLSALKQSLQRDGLRFNSQVFYTAVYDSPIRVINRHNEVWIPKL